MMTQFLRTLVLGAVLACPWALEAQVTQRFDKVRITSNAADALVIIGEATAAEFNGPLVGNVTGTLTGNVVGGTVTTSGKVAIGAALGTDFFLVAPTSGATVSRTAFFQDATATTGRTVVAIQGGAADTDFSNHQLFQVKEQGGTTRFSVTEQGVVTVRTLSASGAEVALVKDTAAVSASSVAGFQWTSTTDGLNGTLDTGLFRGGAAATVKVSNGNNTAYGTLDALGLKASGVAGGNCTLVTVAAISLTVVNGIVTVCTSP